jgi:hypothetical protein
MRLIALARAGGRFRMNFCGCMNFCGGKKRQGGIPVFLSIAAGSPHLTAVA